MIRHLLASHHPAWAAQLGIPRTLASETDPATGVASGPPPAQTPAVASGPPPAQTPAVAVTFDDGPHPEGTPAILDVLAAHDARAVFFVIGEQAVQRPELLQRISDGGHAVALHGYRHRLHSRRSAEDLRRDFARGVAVIEDAIGQSPRYHRPPYGIYSPASLRLARELQLRPLLWSAWGKDWRRLTTPERIARRVGAGELSHGDVILLHDADYYSARGSYQRTVKALSLIMTELESAGLGTFLGG